MFIVKQCILQSSLLSILFFLGSGASCVSLLVDRDNIRLTGPLEETGLAVCAGSSCAILAHPTIGELRASARAVQLGGGLPLFNHPLIMAVTHLSGSSLHFILMESRVSDEAPSSRPT